LFDQRPLTHGARVSRFVWESGKLKGAIGGPISGHFRVFVPRRTDVDLSVFHTSGMTEAAVWDHGARHAGRPEPPVGRGDLLAEQIESVATAPMCVKETAGPPNHASILGWPPVRPEAEEEGLARRSAIAKELAVMATGVMAR